jgi:uncharacterized protein (TIGR02453 family)
MSEINFPGFSEESVQFFLELRLNNTRSWFEAHKADYERHVLMPARAFVNEMGNRLQTVSPGIKADPGYNQSIFRIHRDTRFSRDKSPYKNHLGILFWEGSLPKKECPGFYFHLEPPFLMLADGMYTFSTTGLKAYRDAVADPQRGGDLLNAIQTVNTAGPYQIGGLHYKRVPRGYDLQGERADLLRHNGLFASLERSIPQAFYSRELLDYCYEHYLKMVPLHRWLVELMETIGSSYKTNA